jgi:hypothetical protein
MSQIETLDIFKNLKQYFQILCNDKCAQNDCNELINKLALVNCGDESSAIKPEPEFLNALNAFAVELRKADMPLGMVTIKDKLKKYWDIAKNDEKYKENLTAKNFVKVFETLIETNSNDLSGFKLDNMAYMDNSSNNITYKDILLKQIETFIKKGDKDFNMDINNELYNVWLDASFSLYDLNHLYFKNNIKDKLIKLDECEKYLLTNYFKITINDKDIDYNEYIESYLKEDEIPARLNTIIKNGKAKIVELLPEAVRDTFNKLLITPLNDVDMGIVYVPEKKCYELEKIDNTPTSTPVWTLDKNKIKEIFDYFKKTINEINNNNKENYTQDNNIDGLKIVNYSDKWRAVDNNDDKGVVFEYKKDENSVWEVYDEKTYDKDFENKSTKICLFNNEQKCKEFFNELSSGNMNIEYLKRILNDADTDFNDLRTNISSIDPYFIVGTLKMFGFEKYTELNKDGSTKLIKFESFKRWWERNKYKYGFNENATAPSKLESFFKILIEFINGNEFILNSKTKEFYSKKPVISKKTYQDYLNAYLAEPDKKDKNDNIIKDEYKESLKKQINTKSKSINSLYNHRNDLPNLRIADNRLNLKDLLNLVVRVTTNGKISLQKLYPFSTGIGFQVGGELTNEDLVKLKDSMYPTALQALNLLMECQSELKNLNKTIDDNTFKNIYDNIISMNGLEEKIYKQLQTISKYDQIIRTLDEKTVKTVGENEMNKEITEYEKAGKKLSTQTTNLHEMLKNIMNNKERSFYNSISK